VDDIERDDKRVKSYWHHRDEDRWNYKRYRKPKELVDGSYLDWDPRYPGDRKHPQWDMHPGKDHPWWHLNRDKNWQHPSWWETRDPYGPPPGANDKNWWWYGNQDAPWRKTKGYWENGKWIPIDVANHV